MWMRVWILVLIAVMAGVADAEAAPKKKGKKGKKKAKPLTMEQGTMQLGGQGTVDITSGGGITNVGVTVAPQFGYFVADQVELLVDVGVSHVGGGTSWQVGAGGRYLIPLDNSMWLYAGATVGYGQFSFGGVGADALVVTGLPGLLYPLSKNVALDLGARVQYLNASGTSMIVVPVGYLGVQAFFKK